MHLPRGSGGQARAIVELTGAARAIAGLP